MVQLELSKKELKIIDRALCNRGAEIRGDIKFFDSSEEFTETICKLKSEYKEIEDLRNKIFRSL